MAKENVRTLTSILIGALGGFLGGLGVYFVTRDKKEKKK